MLSSRLRWRALAVLGALLASIMIEWPSTGFAMPAAINTTILTKYEMPSQMTNFSNNINCLGGDSSNNTYAFNLTRSNEISTNLNRNCSATSFNSKNYSSDDVIDSKNRSSSVNININSNNSDNIRNNNNDNSSSSSSNSSRSSSSSSSDRNCCSSDSIIDIKYKNILTNYDDNIEKNIKISSSSSLSSPLSSSSLSKTPVISETNLNVNRIKKFSNNIYNRRKRKKINKININNNNNNNNNSVNVYHVTAETLRSLQISSSSSSSSSSYNNRLESFKKRSTSENYEKQIMLQDSTFYDVTTIIPIIDNSTIFHYLSRTDRSIHTTSNQRYYQRKLNTSSNLDRNERSTNLSHISGPARKIQLYIKNRFIQLLPDGTINGTQDDLSDYTILQRTTVDVGQIKIQGVATCLYLCMDQCGTVYGSKVFTDDCVFNESMEQHNYNTYSSTFNSNSRRILYLALNRHGEPRKLQIPPTRPLGKLATYTKALTETVPQERVEQLIARTFGANRVKHGLRQLCDGGKPLIELTAKVMKEHPKCNINNSNNNNNNNSNNNSNSNMNNNNNQSKNSNEFAPAAVSGRLRISSQSTNSGSNNSSSSINSNGNLKKKKKKRRCKPDEAEGSNCHRPQALKKRPHKGKCPPDDEACHLSRKNKKKQHQHQQQQQQHHREQQQQQQHHHQSSKQNGGGGGGNGNHKSKKKPNGQQHNNGKKGKHNGRITTTTIRPTPTSTIPIQTTTPSMQFTSTEQQDNDGETDSDDLLTAASMEDDEDEDISSVSSIAEHTQLVGGVGDDFFYDNDYDV